MPKVRLALAQTNPVVGDIVANLQLVFDQVELASQLGADIVLFGEMVVNGYPVEDLAYRRDFIEQTEKAVDEFAAHLNKSGLGHIRVVLGHISHAPANSANHWSIAQNAASVLHQGHVIGRYAKHHLPNYSVFDEYRIFVPGEKLLTFEVNELRFSTLICEDIWQKGGPVAELASANTDVALILNGSPFEIDKDDRRLNLITDLANEHKCAVAYVNLVGGQDDLVFDGDSMLLDSNSSLVFRAPKFAQGIAIVDILDRDSALVTHSEFEMVEPVTQTLETSADEELADIWRALVVGLRDYVRKNKFRSVILGLSGGIDSAVCAAIAKDALGSDGVYGVSLPSKYSSDHSKSDAFDLAERLGIHIRTEPIEAIVAAGEEQLKLEGLAAENLQARARALILMAISNAENHLVLTTGNKTELAVGYSTIYGDSVGGFGPIKDVPKTLVWQLAKFRNRLAKQNGEVEPIPQNSITKPPSAELRPGQLDQDSLPEYEVLDKVLEAYLNLRLSSAEIVRLGFEQNLVDRVLSLVDRAEWKRRQGAIGTKITSLSFGRDRRMPITNRNKP